jgi:hypothetical protein
MHVRMRTRVRSSRGGPTSIVCKVRGITALWPPSPRPMRIRIQPSVRLITARFCLRTCGSRATVERFAFNRVSPCVFCVATLCLYVVWLCGWGWGGMERRGLRASKKEGLLVGRGLAWLAADHSDASASHACHPKDTHTPCPYVSATTSRPNLSPCMCAKLPFGVPFRSLALNPFPIHQLSHPPPPLFITISLS